MASTNRHESRESWLRAATNMLRPHFEQSGYPLPDKMRFAIALTSSGRNVEARPGETWHSSVSADETWEIIIRADKSDPVEVLGILVHELVRDAGGSVSLCNNPDNEAAKLTVVAHCLTSAEQVS